MSNQNPFPGTRRMLTEFDAALDAHRDEDGEVTNYYDYDSTLGDWEEGSMEHLRELAESEAVLAAEALAEVLDGYVLCDIAGKLTCVEADALARFVAAWGSQELADGFLQAHADEDEPGDAHYADEDEDEGCPGHESTSGPIGNVVYCDGSCGNTF